MNKKVYIHILLASLLILSLGCSGNGTPVTQDIRDQVTPHISNSVNCPQIWGFWDISIDTQEGTIEVIPLRGASFTANVIKFIDGPPINLNWVIGTIDPQPTYWGIPVDVSITHPFPGLDKFTGFDVLGVFMGNGTDVYPGTGGYAVAGDDDQILGNADGYTRWFNQPEFAGAGSQMPLVGYIDGDFGSPGYTPSAVLNPYKYFTDGLAAEADALSHLVANADDRGVFRPGSVNHRLYDLIFPKSVGVNFQYAVIARWEPNLNHPDPPLSLDDFPEDANAVETPVISVDDSSSTAYYAGPGDFGGNIIMDISTVDFHKPSVWDDEFTISYFSDAWSGEYTVPMTPTASDDTTWTFTTEIPVEMLDSADDLPVWIEINYPDFDYSNEFGVNNDADGSLASYFLVTVDIIDESQPSGNFIYAFGDFGMIGESNKPDNDKMFTNMLNLPLTGPYAGNNVVMWYYGHGSSDYGSDNSAFITLVGNLGYSYVTDDSTALDLTGVKFVVLSFLFQDETDLPYTASEIQEIKNFVNGGGTVAILVDNTAVMHNNIDTVNQLCSDLGLGIQYPTWSSGDEVNSDALWTDITPDPIMNGVGTIEGNCGGSFTVFGEAQSLARGDNDAGTEIVNVIVKSPIS